MNPWMKFYPQDWRADEKLRMCSLAARGLWIEIMSLMHRSEKYGFLLISGRVPSDAQLAMQVGAPIEQITDLLAELETCEVFSRNSTGIVFSRRMVRDQKKVRTSRENGKKGGNPKLSNTKEKSDQDNQGVKSEDNVEDIQKDNPDVKGGVKAQKPDTRYQIDSVPNGTGEMPSISDQIWSTGLAYLRSTAIPERSARSLLGKWRKTLGDPGLLKELIDCQAKAVSDPVSYMEAVIRNKPTESKSTGDAYLDRLARIAEIEDGRV